MKNLALFLLMFASTGALRCRGAEFIDLGFDDADITGLYRDANGRPHGQAISSEKALPGWSLYFGQQLWSVINVNDPPIFVPANDATLGDGQLFGDPVDETSAEPRLALRLMRTNSDSPLFILEQSGTIPADTHF